MLKVGLTNPRLRWIEATILLVGCWTGRSDMMHNTMWWRFSGSSKVVNIVVFFYQLSVRERRWRGEMRETLIRAEIGVTDH